MSNNFLTASMSSSSNTVNAYPANSVGMSNGNNYQDPVVAINENPVQNQGLLKSSVFMLIYM